MEKAKREKIEQSEREIALSKKRKESKIAEPGRQKKPNFRKFGF